jgi:hypothetical protein
LVTTALSVVIAAAGLSQCFFTFFQDQPIQVHFHKIEGRNTGNTNQHLQIPKLLLLHRQDVNNIKTVENG